MDNNANITNISTNSVTQNHSMQELGTEIMRYLNIWKKPENTIEAKKIAISHLKEYDNSHEDKTYEIIVKGAFETKGW